MSLHLANTIEVELSAINVLAISPDGRLIASGNEAGKVCIYAIESLQSAYEDYAIGDPAVSALAWSFAAPATLIVGDTWSRLHVLALENQAGTDHDGLARNRVSEIVDAGLGAIWTIDAYEHIVAIGGNKGIKVMEHKPGASLSLISRLPPTGTPLVHPLASCPNSVHIYDTETLFASYNEGCPHHIVAWNMANEE
ncbi:hypothetical protein OF83DRAFT_1175179 [Amylostereum chailletii]|nr:hypothetical protein OF83DRAFT_1175179 [Amylostereum chailletii]